MNALQILAQAAGIAYAAGLNLYATVAIVGLGSRLNWIGPLPGTMDSLASWWVIGIALVLMAIEFLASLMPAVASIWDTLHSLIRPPAAAALAAATAWHGDPAFVLIAALIGGGLAVTTHTTKLGLRYAIDASPEPITNGITSIAELGLVGTIAITIWRYPFLTLGFALIVLALLIALVRLIWKTLRQVFAGRWVPRQGFRQDARTSDRLGRREDD
jgi:Na+-transporting methylmalonyl-CoA/oxaloacetate decarboxylase gamma subunit